MSQQPLKAYKNLEFLNSPGARTIRIVCEYEETRRRLREHGVQHTVVFFGSARIRSPEQVGLRLERDRAALAERPEDADLIEAVARSEKLVALGRYYEEARELGRRVTEWSMARASQERQYFIASGGGPGIMEAANRGAADVPGGRSVGFGISLPFEQGVNDWVTPELGFEFHYFFMRKYWFLYLCKGLVIFPGGFGTMDELFETLTLIQTKKIKKPLPVVLFGNDYWDAVLDMDAMARFGTISPRDLELVHRTDSVDDAFDYLTRSLTATEQQSPVR